MMRNKRAPFSAPLFAPLFLLLLILLCSCRSINHSRTRLNLPPSIVYLSFDDGPNGIDDTTVRLLYVLKEYHIKAFFCLLGVNAERYPDLVKHIYNEGHCIVNHGYSEKWASKMNEDEFRNNLIRGEEAISSALGHEISPRLYRPQGGFYTSAQEKIIRDEGYILVPGNIRVYDAVIDGTKQNKVVRDIVKKTEKQGGGIILLHDARDSYIQAEKMLSGNPQGVYNRSWIPDTVERIITALLDKGFTINSSDNYPY